MRHPSSSNQQICHVYGIVQTVLSARFPTSIPLHPCMLQHHPHAYRISQHDYQDGYHILSPTHQQTYLFRPYLLSLTSILRHLPGPRAQPCSPLPNMAKAILTAQCASCSILILLPINPQSLSGYLAYNIQDTNLHPPPAAALPSNLTAPLPFVPPLPPQPLSCLSSPVPTLHLLPKTLPTAGHLFSMLILRHGYG